MPSASSVSAVCFMVGQSDWLPMMIATGFPPIDPPKRPKKKPAIIGTGGGVARRGRKPVEIGAPRRLPPPKQTNWGARLLCGTGEGISLSFANDVSERSFEFAALQYGVGGLPIMRRANAQLRFIRRAAIVAAAQCGFVRARPTKTDPRAAHTAQRSSR